MTEIISKKKFALKKYLPKDAVKHVNKDWLVSLMHSLDTTLFERLIIAIDEKRKNEKPKKIEKEFDIDPEMLELLKDYSKGKTVKANPRSLS